MPYFLIHKTCSNGSSFVSGTFHPVLPSKYREFGGAYRVVAGGVRHLLRKKTSTQMVCMKEIATRFTCLYFWAVRGEIPTKWLCFLVHLYQSITKLQFSN